MYFILYHPSSQSTIKIPIGSLENRGLIIEQFALILRMNLKNICTILNSYFFFNFFHPSFSRSSSKRDLVNILIKTEKCSLLFQNNFRAKDRKVWPILNITRYHFSLAFSKSVLWDVKTSNGSKFIKLFLKYDLILLWGPLIGIIFNGGFSFELLYAMQLFPR